jgi:hypothetical protein
VRRALLIGGPLDGRTEEGEVIERLPPLLWLRAPVPIALLPADEPSPPQTAVYRLRLEPLSVPIPYTDAEDVFRYDFESMG